MMYFWQFVMAESHSKLLADMLESHAVHDFCLVGPKVSIPAILLCFTCNYFVTLQLKILRLVFVKPSTPLWV